MFLIKRESKCTPFWKNSRFWATWMEATCSLVLGIQITGNSLALDKSLYQPLLKMIVLSFYSAKVETEVQ